MKKVLITGASGFIGSYLKEHLTGFEISTLSLRDPNWKKQPIDADVVIHCAGLAHSKKSLPRAHYMDVNCHLTRELLQHSINHNVSHFIYLSTMLVYGEGHIGAIDRDSPINPKSAYSESKVCAEKLILDSKIIDTTILRLPLVYGIQMKGNLMLLARLSSVSPVFLKINNLRSILMIEDLSNLISEVIVNKSLGLMNPHSRILSTSELFILLRGNKNTHLLSIPQFLNLSLKKSIPFFSKLFGDAYYI
jgi:nucleoside-diphosphate-sugar epimerase